MCKKTTGRKRTSMFAFVSNGCYTICSETFELLIKNYAVRKHHTFNILLFYCLGSPHTKCKCDMPPSNHISFIKDELNGKSNCQL